MAYVNPYAQAMSYEDELEKRRRQLAAMGVDPQQIEAQERRRSMLADQETYATAQQDLSGMEGRFDNQRAIANRLQATEIPGGRTVGPSQTYVENPYTQAGAAVARLSGAFANRGIDKEEAEKLGPLRQAVARAKADVARGETAEAGRREDVKLTSQETQAEADRKLREAIARADREQSAAQAETTAGLRQQEIDIKAGKAAADAEQMELKTLQRPGGAAGMYGITPDGTMLEGGKGGRVIPPTEALNIITYEPEAEGGSTPQAQRNERVERLRKSWEDGASVQGDLGLLVNQYQQLAQDENLGESMGRLNMDAAIGRSLGVGPGAWKDQTRDMRLKGVGLTMLKDIIRLFAPVSDTDLKTIAATYPGSMNDPGTLFSWMYTSGRHAAMDAARTEGQEVRGQLTPEAQANYDAELEALNDQLKITALEGMKNARIKPTEEDMQAAGILDEDDREFYRRLYRAAYQ